MTLIATAALLNLFGYAFLATLVLLALAWYMVAKPELAY